MGILKELLRLCKKPKRNTKNPKNYYDMIEKIDKDLQKYIK